LIGVSSEAASAAKASSFSRFLASTKDRSPWRRLTASPSAARASFASPTIGTSTV
jgi:hypothetical protein